MVPSPFVIALQIAFHIATTAVLVAGAGVQVAGWFLFRKRPGQAIPAALVREAEAFERLADAIEATRPPASTLSEIMRRRHAAMHRRLSVSPYTGVEVQVLEPGEAVAPIVPAPPPPKRQAPKKRECGHCGAIVPPGRCGHCGAPEMA